MFELIFVVFCYILLFIFFLYLSYSRYSIVVKAPLYVLFVLLLTYTTYVASFCSDKKDQLFETFQRFFVIYGEYILIIIGLFILCIVLYKIFMGVLVFSLTQSLWVTFGLIMLVLALLKNTFYQTSQDSELVTLLKDIVFYIPCLITDGIDFIKKDYSETPTTTFIVFILILVYCTIFFLIPLINTDGGHLLIGSPENLNTFTTFSTDEIILLDNKSYKGWESDHSYNNIPINIPEAKTALYPRDKLTKNIETFVGLVQQDTTYNLQKTYNEKMPLPEQFDIKYFYNQISKNEYLSKINSGYNAFRDLFNQDKDKSPYTYNYSLSFWVYINTFHFKKSAPKMQQILKFGKRVSLMYDNIENELVVLLEDDEVYRSKGILYQRWNHIVINSNDSKLNLFINNNLVGTYNYIDLNKKLLFVDLYDTLDIGSRENSNFGSICNFRYYNKSLDLSKIKSIYTKYNKKNPPI